MRINDIDSKLSPFERGPQITVTINGRPATAYEGESVAAVLLAEGRRIFRRTLKQNAPRGLFCGMGVCYDCLVTIDGTPNVRACLTTVAEAMIIETRSELSG